MVVLVAAALAGAIAGNERAASVSPVAAPRVADLTPLLVGTFHPGAIQGFGYNGSGGFLAGISAWNKAIDQTDPELAAFTDLGVVTNVTPTVAEAFRHGGVFGTVWNGSAWMLSGEATWGATSGGVLYALHGDLLENLTPRVASYFHDGGIWAVGWNGTAWLLAGNSSSGASMVAWSGGTATDLTGLLPHNPRGGFIQLLVWNGTGWLVGGKGVFGALAGGRYTDLLVATPFATGGVFGADWNGSAWLVGGGAPAALVVVDGTTVRQGPALPPTFDRWASGVVSTPTGWVVVGKGSGGATGSTPQLVLVSPDLGVVTDLSSQLPASFAGGQVQFAGWAPWLGPMTLLLVGQGDLNETTGYSVGAMASLTLPDGR